MISLLAALAAALPAGGVAAAPPGWKAGVAKVVITPPGPMWMSGYASRDKPADGVLHDLWAKALALEDPAGNRLVLITADLIGTTRALTGAVAAHLERAHRLPRAALMFATSHTHSGPMIERNLTPMVDLPEGEAKKVREYTAALEKKLIRLADDALSALAPAALSWGNGTCGFAVNRRNNPEAGVPELRAAGALKGPVDHDVPVLRVAAPDGRLRAVVFGYACHNTVLSGYQWCGDYAGFAQIEIEKAQPGALALYFAGCGGDQNPLPRRKVELAEKYGRELADSVAAVLAGRLEPIAGAAAARFAEVDLPFERIPTADDLAEQLKNKNVYEQRRARLLTALLKADGRLSPTYPYPVQVWRPGAGPTWIALGGEVVVDYSIRLKKELGPGRTWVTAYAGDVPAYIPSARVLAEGGYEGGGAMVYYGLPSRWGGRVEELIVEKVRSIVPAGN
jgi:hypothetical protein